MTDTVKQLRVNELNRILPMVREAIETDHLLMSINKGICQKESQLKNVEEEISKLREFLCCFEHSVDADAKNSIEKLLAKKEKEKQQLINSIATDNEKHREIFKPWDFKIKLYLGIVAAISTTEGFLNVDDIQEEFLKEYIYLLVMGDVSEYRHHRVEIKRIFISATEFCKLISKSFSIEQESVLQTIKDMVRDRNKFFELCG